MPQIIDRFGNPYPDQLDTVGGEVVTETGRAYTQTLSSNGAVCEMDVNGAAAVALDLFTAAGSLSFIIEGSQDGTNYRETLVPFDKVLETHVLPTTVVTTTLQKLYVVGVSGLKRVRVRITAFVSGTLVVAARATRADFLIYAKFLPATLWVTATGAANAAVTLTIPAAGIGLFHYITGVWIGRAGAAALAGTAVLVITTTNWPGSAAFSVGNASPAGGTQRDVELVASNPIKTSAANTATTIVMPVPGAGVLWRANVSYYVGA